MNHMIAQEIKWMQDLLAEIYWKIPHQYKVNCSGLPVIYTEPASDQTQSIYYSDKSFSNINLWQTSIFLCRQWAFFPDSPKEKNSFTEITQKWPASSPKSDLSKAAYG